MAIDKYHIIVIAGQSNAQGYGEGICLNSETEKANPRVKQLGRYAVNFGKIIDATYCLEHIQNINSYTHPSNSSLKGLVGWGMYLGNLLSHHIPSNEGILLVPCARGGSGFSAGVNKGFSKITGANPESTKWGTTSDLFYDLKNHTEIALNAKNESGKKNTLVGVCWIQGEFDQSINNGLDHKPAFEEMVRAFNDFLMPYKDQLVEKDPCKVPWICGTSTRYWETQSGYNNIFGKEGTYGKSNLSQVIRLDLTNDGIKKMPTNLPEEDPDIPSINYVGSNKRVVSSSVIRESHFSSMANRISIPKKFEKILKPIIQGKGVRRRNWFLIILCSVVGLAAFITALIFGVPKLLKFKESISKNTKPVIDKNPELLNQNLDIKNSEMLE
ncbi:9-O-acetyl-N-acetylneuraminic acid deacetylase-like protein [Carp edema virus]|nr:9-O-acetyl-N-acetylneuraminic acid deacetylase-like protein [Carp edema virus]